MKKTYSVPQTICITIETTDFIATSTGKYSVTMDGGESGLVENTSTLEDCGNARSNSKTATIREKSGTLSTHDMVPDFYFGLSSHLPYKQVRGLRYYLYMYL